MTEAHSERYNGTSPLRVPGLGTIARQLLEEHGVRTLGDLARTDPYDTRFRILGEPFPSWVMYARAMVAEEIIVHIEVSPRAIRVVCRKAYDRQASRNAVLGRMGVYDIYVNVGTAERPDSYEFLITLKPEQVKFGMAQWMEYRNNAVQLQRELEMKMASLQREAPLQEARWPLDSFVADLRERARGVQELEQLMELCYRICSTDSFNLLVIWDRDSMNRSLVRGLLAEFVPKCVHVICGGNSPVEMQEQIALEGDGGVVIFDDPDRGTPEEKKIILDLMATRGTKISYGGKRTEVSVRAKFILNVWQPERGDETILDPDALGLVHLALKLPPNTDRQAFKAALDKKPPVGQDVRDALAETLSAEVGLVEAPQNMLEELNGYRPPRHLEGYGERLDEALRQLAVALARQRRSPIVEPQDYDDSMDLIRAANSTLVHRSRRGNRGT